MRRINEMINDAIYGVGLGTVVTFLLITAQGEFAPAPPEFIKDFSSVGEAVEVQLIVFALIGILQKYTSNIYNLFREKSIVVQYIIHYFSIIFPLILVGYYLKWYTDVYSLVYMVLTSSFIYFVILMFNILKLRSELKKINNKIEKYR